MLSCYSPLRSALTSRRTASYSHLHQYSLLTQNASVILPRLFLSGLWTAVDEDQLVRLGVTHVVSVIEQKPHYPKSLPLDTLHVPLMDVPHANILQYLDTTTNYIKTALADKRNVVLVHCAMGISRSATVVCAYLIATRSLSTDQAIDFLRSRRAIVCPNLGFRIQLARYATRIQGRRRLRKCKVPFPPPLREMRSMMAGGRFRWLWRLPPQPPAPSPVIPVHPLSSSISSSSSSRRSMT